MKQISPQDLKKRLRGLHDGEGELALLDVREQSVYGRGHLFFAACLPVSRLELLAPDLLPCRRVPIVLCDGGDADGGLAEHAATRLALLGYEDISLLQGGVAAWAAAGYEVFSGVNVPSKAFGEFVEVTYGTPHLPAAEVARLSREDRDMVILDSRPMAEFRDMSIPGGVDAPGAELVYRVHDMAPDPETLVVVNCAGRTRSIIGAQSLVNAGIPNPVAALKDGTMGWHLAGLSLAHGETTAAPPPSPAGLRAAQEAARRVVERFGVQTISRAELSAWQAETDSRSLFLLDVRGPEEFAAGHLPGSRSAPGGQLVQATDEYLGVLGARVVLIDDTGVRATMTASWLIQMGWRHVAVLEGGLAGPLETGAAPLPDLPAVLHLSPVDSVSALELKAILDSGEPAGVIDLSPSPVYRQGHIPGAAWALRGRFDHLKRHLATFGLIIVTADDPRMIRLAMPDLAAALPHTLLRGLDGGTAAWRDQGWPLEEGLTWALCDDDDAWEKPYGDPAEMAQEMRDYLTWEVGLVDQIARDGDANFRRFD